MTKGQVLYLTTRDIDSPTNGGSVRAHYVQHELRNSGWNVVALYYGEEQKDNAVDRPPHEFLIPFWPSFYLRLFTILLRTEVDAVVTSHAGAATYGIVASLLGRVPLVLDEHNVEVQLEIDKGQYLKAAGIGLFEWLAWKLATIVTVPSEVDAEHVAKHTRGTVVLLRNGFDADRFEPRDYELADNNRLLFFGKMDYEPNIEAVQTITDTIAPELARIDDTIQIDIVGQNCESVVELVEPVENVHLVGFVDDIVECIQTHSLVIVPLRTGGGTRLKIVETLAAGRVVISTPKGAEGLPDNWNNLHIEDADEFTKQIVSLVDDIDFDESEYEKIATFSWERQVSKLDDLLQARIPT
jgi:glycosyltransferase involved in cell wall biosynthesis